MIQINQNISLQVVTTSDCEELYSLMKEVYTPAYQHFWKDNGNWYIEKQYSEKNVKKELLEKKTAYYFVIYQGKKIGNFRVLWDKKLQGLKNMKTLKLHRIYLHPKTRGNGIGKTLLTWLENKAKQKNYELIWLDAMDEQPEAFQFYKKQGYIYHSHEFLDFELLHNQVRKMSQLYKKINP